MSQKIFLYGESGTGKTSSIRNLDPKKTGMINIDRKPLPLQGWRNTYVTVKKTNDTGLLVSDLEKSNYVEPKTPGQVLSTLVAWNKREDLEIIVMDTITHMITADYMNNTIGKEFKDYQKMGLNAFKIFDFIRDMEKDVIVVAHSDSKYSETGQKVITMKSYGNMIENMVPQSFFTTVLITVVERDKEGSRYLFRTQSDGPDAAKSPAIFKGDKAVPALDLHVPNDINFVLEELAKFETTTQ